MRISSRVRHVATHIAILSLAGLMLASCGIDKQTPPSFTAPS